jgi:hypothetical protein
MWTLNLAATVSVVSLMSLQSVFAVGSVRRHAFAKEGSGVALLSFERLAMAGVEIMIG